MPHISYSELKDWKFCPFYHKLTRVDKIEGFNYGQKAGYWINDEGDERLIGAGYLIEQSNSERGYVVVFMTQGDEADDLWDRSRLATSPRHKVWPLIIEFVTEQAQPSPN